MEVRGGQSLSIEIGWPSPKLSPNARVHFMEAHRFKKAAKDTAFWLTRAALGHSKWFDTGAVNVRLTAHPIKGKVRPDADNLIASHKATLDGIALGLGVDDKSFNAPSIDWADPVPNGKIIISLEAA